MAQGSFFKTLVKRLQVDDVSGLAAQLSYFFLLSLFPLLIFLFTLLAYLPFSQEDILNTIQKDPTRRFDEEIIEANLSEVLEANGTLLSFGVIGTIWSASNGMNAIIKAFNHAYGVKRKSNFLYFPGNVDSSHFSDDFCFYCRFIAAGIRKTDWSVPICRNWTIR